MKRKLFFILLLSVCIPFLYSEGTDITREWKQIYGDKSGYAETGLDDSSWKRIDLSVSLDASKNANNDKYMWVRKNISLSPGNYRLDLGKVEAAIEVYFNGSLILKNGRMGDSYFTNGGIFLSAYLPKGQIQPDGNNVIAIRLFTDSGIFPRIFISVYDVNENQFRKPLVDFLNMYLNLAFSILSLVITLFYLLQFLLFKKRVMDLYFSLANFAIFIYFLESGIGFPVIKYAVFQMIAKSMLPLFFAFLTVFMMVLYDYYNRKVLKIIIFIAAGLVSFTFYLLGRTISDVDSVFNIALLVGGIELIFMLFMSIKAVIQKKADSLVIFFGVSAGILSAVFDFYHFFAGIEPLFWMQGTGIFVFNLSMFTALALHNIRISKQLEFSSKELAEKTGKLENFVTNIRNTSGHITDIASTLNRNINQAADVFSRVAANSNEIDSCARQNLEAVQAMEDAVHEQLRVADSTHKVITGQSRNIAETMDMITSMLSILDEVSGKLDDTSGAAEELSRNTEAGSDAVDLSINAIRMIKQTSENITEIVQTVNDISGRTNLLAMNAAIEAAHAGDSGKGFAVVADEIRKLAEESSERAGEINRHVDDIMEKIDEGVGVNSKVRNMLDQIKTNTGISVNQISELNEMISSQRTASQQVREVLADFGKSSAEIDERMESQARQNEKMKAALSELISTTKQVIEAVRFIMEDSNRLKETILRIRSLSEQSKSDIVRLENVIKND